MFSARLFDVSRGLHDVVPSVADATDDDDLGASGLRGLGFGGSDASGAEKLVAVGQQGVTVILVREFDARRGAVARSPTAPLLYTYSRNHPYTPA